MYGAVSQTVRRNARATAARAHAAQEDALILSIIRADHNFYSLVQSCKLVDVPPSEYLKDVLLRVATHPQRLVGQLTPKGWAATFRRQAAG